MNGLAIADLAVLAAGTGVAGLAAGLLAGLLGVGGGIVIVPMLFWVFTVAAIDPDVAMPVAVASSLTAIIATALSSARAHHNRAALDTALLRRWAPWMAAGALAGGGVAGFLKGDVLLLVFGVVAMGVAINLAIPSAPVLGQTFPRNRLFQPAIAALIGGLSAMMGVGGGALSVPVMTAFSVPIRRAVGTASALGLVIAVPGALAFVLSGIGVAGRPPLSLGYVNVVAVAIILPGSVLMAPLGARLAHTLPPRAVRLAFAVFLAATSVRMLTTALG